MALALARRPDLFSRLRMMAAIGTPHAIVHGLAAALVHPLHDPDAGRQIETLGAAVEAIGPPDFRPSRRPWLAVVRNMSRSQ